MEKREQRKAEQRERQKTEILDVALDVFAARGYEGASMNEIATESGYSVGHIYNVVESKEGLFDEVMIRESRKLTDGLVATIDSCRDGAARECIDRLIDAILEFFDDHRTFFQIYINETGGKRLQIERRFCSRLVDMKKATDELLAKLFSKAISENAAADIDTDDLVIVFSELINGFVAAWAADGYPGKISGKSNVIKHILWNGIQRT
jgi:AcrR family transcriptional regulator